MTAHGGFDTLWVAIEKSYSERGLQVANRLG